MLLVDANILLRAALDDHAEWSPQARELLRNNEILLLPEVIAEVIYVMTKTYHAPRDVVAGKLIELLSSTTVFCEHQETVTLALAEYRRTKFDFVDMLLFARHRLTGIRVETFDHKLYRKIYDA